MALVSITDKIDNVYHVYIITYNGDILSDQTNSDRKAEFIRCIIDKYPTKIMGNVAYKEVDSECAEAIQYIMSQIVDRSIYKYRHDSDVVKKIIARKVLDAL